MSDLTDAQVMEALGYLIEKGVILYSRQDVPSYEGDCYIKKDGFMFRCDTFSPTTVTDDALALVPDYLLKIDDAVIIKNCDDGTWYASILNLEYSWSENDFIGTGPTAAAALSEALMELAK